MCLFSVCSSPTDPGRLSHPSNLTVYFFLFSDLLVSKPTAFSEISYTGFSRVCLPLGVQLLAADPNSLVSKI